MNAAARFFAKVEPDPSGCLIWIGAATKEGYGRFQGEDGKAVQAHRWLLERVLGPQVGLDADHLCRNPRCVRPSHIEFVTRRENIMRGDSPSVQRARAAARLTCAHGHPWTTENTYIYVDRHGKRTRQCKACMARRVKERRAS